MPLVAITREVSPAIAACELTHIARAPIDLELAREQHAEYERALEGLGCAVTRLASDATMPDAVFVEDTAIVFDELAIVARPGASSRRGETEAVAAALASHRPLASIDDPGTIDGGDVLVMGRAVLVGSSSRTNRAGIDQLVRLVEPLAYRVTAVPIRQCLHLKSAVTALGDETLLVDRASLDPAALDLFRRFRIVESDPAEPRAANVLRVGDTLLASAACPRTRERLEKRAFRVATVDVSELAKAEGAVTCCSLIFASGGTPRH